MAMTVAAHPLVLRPPADLIRTQTGLKRLATDLALRYAHRELVTEDRLRAMGEGLWRALDATALFDQARTAAGLGVLPIVIESSEPAVLQLPWETLHHPELGFLGRDPGYALSRRPAPPPDGTPVPARGPLRVLLFTSLPEDLDAEHGRLDVEAEQAAVQEALAPWVAEGRVDLRMPNDGRLATLAAEIRSFQPHLVFLSGHGRFLEQPLADTAAHGVVVFEGLHGESDSVLDTEIAAAFVGSAVWANNPNLRLIPSLAAILANGSLPAREWMARCFRRSGGRLAATDREEGIGFQERKGKGDAYPIRPVCPPFHEKLLPWFEPGRFRDYYFLHVS